MFENMHGTNLKFKYVISGLCRGSNGGNKRQKNLKTILLLESLFFKTEGFDQLSHYDLIDPDCSEYSLIYDQRVTSQHYKIIFFLSLILNRHDFSDIKDPLDSFCQLENLIKSPQLYRNILFHNSIHGVDAPMECMIAELKTAIMKLKNWGCNATYKKIKQDNDHDDMHPLELNSFINQLLKTLTYFQETYEKLMTL